MTVNVGQFIDSMILAEHSYTVGVHNATRDERAAIIKEALLNDWHVQSYFEQHNEQRLAWTNISPDPEKHSRITLFPDDAAVVLPVEFDNAAPRPVARSGA